MYTLTELRNEMDSLSTLQLIERIEKIKQQLLIPFYLERKIVRDRIAASYPHKEQVDGTVTVTGYSPHGNGARAALLPELDTLNAEIRPLADCCKLIEREIAARKSQAKSKAKRGVMPRSLN